MYWIETFKDIALSGIAIMVSFVLALLGASFITDRERNKGAHSLLSIVIFLGMMLLMQKAVMPKVMAWNEVNKLDSAMSADPIFSALKKYQPASYAEMSKKIKDQVASGQKLDLAIGSVKDNFSALLSKNVSYASNHAAYSFLKATHQTIVELKDNDGGDSCYDQLYPDQSKKLPSVSPKVSTATKQEFSAAFIEIIESTSTARQTPPTDGEVLPVLKNIVSDMATKYGQDVAVMQAPKAPGVNKTQVCTLTIALFDRILQLPPDQAGLVMRFLAHI